MPKQIQKSIQECISKIKILNKQIQFPACRHIRKASFAVEERENDAATLADIDQFLFENFRSLYQKEYEEKMTKNEAKTTTYQLDSPQILKSPPAENLYSSDRFFVASGSSSSRIVEEASSFAASTFYSASPDEFIVLLTQSWSPYADFRRSIEEMVEAHLQRNGRVDWEYLEELLRCYLDLNTKNSHKYVVEAFVDAVEVLRANSWGSAERRGSQKEAELEKKRDENPECA